MNEQNTTENNISYESVDLKETILNYLKYWPIFIISVVIAILVAFLYLRYENNVYSSSGKIKILKDNQGLDLSAMGGNSPLFDFSEVNLENEIEIIKSRKLLSNVVDRADLQTKFKREGRLKSFLLYDDEIPVNVKWNMNDTINTGNFEKFDLNILNQETFKIEIEELGYSKKHNFDEKIKIESYSFTLSLKSNISKDIFGKPYSFKFLKKEGLISNLNKSIKVEQVGEISKILQIEYNGSNKDKNEAIIDALIEEFKLDGVRDNRKVAKRTKDFVDERLDTLVGELNNVEQNLVDYKKSNELVNVQSNAEVLFQKSSEYESEYSAKSKQLSLAKLFKQELNEVERFDLLPINFGLSNSSVNTLTKDYNNLILEREKLLVSSTQNNSQVIEINQQIDNLRRNIQQSINNYIESLKKAIKEIKVELNQYEDKIASLPQNEKTIRQISRQQMVKEELYLFLLQKQLEAGLSYAVASPKVKIVDYAYTNPDPISPRRSIVFLSSLVIGFAVPFGFLFLKFLFYTKINSKFQIEKSINKTPIIAEIPSLRSQDKKIVDKYDNSPAAEGFRILRTNLSFFIKSKQIKKEKGNIVFVTSSTKGEGKTFVSSNLASVYAATGKKTLLVGTDLRNPQLHNLFNSDKNEKGLTNYLIDEETNIDKLIKKDLMESNIDVMFSGPIPPNPSELLENPNLVTLFDELKLKYDHIVVDTAPTVLVSDTLLTTHLADVLVYVIRAEYTELRLLEHINKFKDFNKLINMGIVFNDISEENNYAYNYGYGYGYSASKVKKTGLKFWRN